MNIFNDQFKYLIKRKSLLFKILLIYTVIIYLIDLVLFIVIHDTIEKNTFIIINIILSFLNFTFIFIEIKSILYHNKLSKLINNPLNFEYLEGIIRKKDTYDITIQGLTFEQYELIEETNKIIYVLKGINIDNILNNEIKVGVINNILYYYEVNNE
mgnify:CR=1 FL=1